MIITIIPRTRVGYINNKLHDVRGQISELIFASNGSHCVYHPSNILKTGKYLSDIPPFYLGAYLVT